MDDLSGVVQKLCESLKFFLLALSVAFRPLAPGWRLLGAGHSERAGGNASRDRECPQDHGALHQHGETCAHTLGRTGSRSSRS